MKKALLPAIISALFATSAQAANLYDADGTAVNLSAEIDALYKTSTSETEADEDGVLNTWANVQFDVTTKVSDSVTALGSFEVEADNGASVEVDDAWLGFATDFGTVKFGETGSSYDVLEKTELSNELDEYDAIYSDSEGDGRAVRYEKTVGPVALSANYSFESGDSDADNFALSADYAVDMFTIGAAYLDGDDTTSMGISASVEVADLYVAATYTDNEFDAADDFTTAALSASYALDLATVYGSYQIQDFDAGADIDHWYAGVSHDITANISAFVEYSDTEADDAAEASLLVAGIYYTF